MTAASTTTPPVLDIHTSQLFRRHDTGIDHPERPARMDAAIAGVERAGLTSRLIHDVANHPETNRIIAKVHSDDYEQQLEDACRSGMRLFHSLDNPISSHTFRAARAAVGSALVAADAIWEEQSSQRAFIIARPPGHHAERTQAMGFCFFNTIACVAEWLREKPGIERVLIFDFDVHHGNGTQHLFQHRPDVFYASLHRFPFYPGTGAASEIGVGEGRGFTRNVELAAGATDTSYLDAVEGEILPLIDEYAPQAILLSAGFDAHARDPLGGMQVTEQGFAGITDRIVEAASRHSGGRVLSLLEGGYDMEALTASVAAHALSLAQ